MPNSPVQLVSLGECVDIVSGYAFDAGLFSGSKGTPIVRIRDVKRGRTETYFSGEFDEKYLLSDGDLLVGMDGEFNVGVWAGGEALLNQRVCKITARESHLDQAYLKHFLPGELKKIEGTTSFATVKHLSVKSIREIKLLLPAIEDQRRIAAVLDEADELRAKRRRSVDLLDELELSLSHAVQTSGDNAHEIVLLTDLCRPKQWPTISTKQLTPTGFVVYGANGPIGFYDEYTHENPTIAITCRGATCGTVNVTPSKTYINGNAMALDDLKSDKITLEYLASALRFRGLADVISGSAQPQITREGLRAVTIPVPPMDVQEQFSSQICRINELRMKVNAQIETADELFASLQDRAFKGEL